MREPMREPMRVRRVIDDEREVNVGAWDWEQFVAHQSGRLELTQQELMSFVRNDARVAAAQAATDEDARQNARQLAVVVEGFLSEAECDAMVAQVEGEGLLSETKSETLQRLLADCNFEGDDEKLDQKLRFAEDVRGQMWSRLHELDGAGEEGRALLGELRTAPEWSARDHHVRHAGTDMEMRLSTMSDYIRLMKYSAPREATATGDFDTDPRNAHHDGRNQRAEGDSFLTALLYLNSEEDEGLQGGGTLFLDTDGATVARVSPKKGALLIFDHHLYHKGESVAQGVKYVLRSDLLYRACDARTGEALK